MEGAIAITQGTWGLRTPEEQIRVLSASRSPTRRAPVSRRRNPTSTILSTNSQVSTATTTTSAASPSSNALRRRAAPNLDAKLAAHKKASFRIGLRWRPDMECTVVSPATGRNIDLTTDHLVSARRWPLLSLLARGHGLLCRQHICRGRLGQEKVLACARRLLRVPSPQEGGPSSHPGEIPDTTLTRFWLCSTPERWPCRRHTRDLSRRRPETMPRAPGKYGTWACWARRKILRRSLGAAEQRPVLPMVRNSGDYDQVYITCWFAAQFEEIYFIVPLRSQLGDQAPTSTHDTFGTWLQVIFLPPG